MKARKTTKEKKTGQGGRKAKPTTMSEPNVTALANHVNGSRPEPEPIQCRVCGLPPAAHPQPDHGWDTPPVGTPTPPAPRDKKEPWDRGVPFAVDVKTKGSPVVLTGPAGTFTATYNQVESATKDQRWTVTDAAGVVVGQHSQYWPAVLDARRRSMGK